MVDFGFRRWPSRSRSLISFVALSLATLGATVVVAQPAHAASCTFPSGSEVHTRAYYQNQATAKLTVTIKNGTTLTGSQFIDDTTGQKMYSNEKAPTQAWFRASGDYSYGNNFTNNGCYAVAVVSVGTSTHAWFDFCIAASPGQIHTRCNWNLPENQIGALWTGLYNASTQKFGTNPDGSYMSTS